MADEFRLIGPVSVANLTAAAGVTTTTDGWWPCLDLTWRTPVPARITKITAQVRERGADGRYSQPADTVLTDAELAAGAAKIVNGVSIGQHLEVRLVPAGAQGLPFQATPWVEATTPYDALMAALGRDPDPDVRPLPDLPHGYQLAKSGSAVIGLGGSGSWKQAFVEMPQVSWDPVLGKYVMLFNGFTGTPGSPSVTAIGRATSDDLLTWAEDVGNPVFSRTSVGGDPDENGVSHPFLMYEDGTYYLFYLGRTATGYAGGTKTICLATSTDFSTWTRHGAVISPLAATWRSAGLGRPCVVKRSATYYLFFNANNTIGYATSKDLLTWTVDDTTSPVLSDGASGWDAVAIGDPSLYRVGDVWYLSYYGQNGSGNKQQGLAFTSDADFPLGWTKFSGNPVLALGAGGSFDDTDAGRGSVLLTGSRLYLWYSADDGSNGLAIGLAVDNSLNPAISGSTGSDDNRLLRSDGTGGKTVQASAIAVSDTGAFTFPDDVRQTFNPGSTNAGLNVGALAGDPGSPSNGDLWYDSTANELTARINGANVALGAATGANPTATASDTAVNGSASTFMRSDAAPAIQKASSSQFGIVKVDGSTITESGGVISAVGGGGGGSNYEIAPTKPVASDFTLENAGTASMADGTYGIVLTMPSSTFNVRFIRQNAALPGSSWTLIMRGSAVTPYLNSNIHHTSVILRNSANGRLINFAQNNSQLLVQTFSSYTAFNANIAAFGASYGVSTAWKKVTSDGTTLRFYVSPNGADWAEIGSQAIATYLSAVNQVGFGSVNTAASGVTNVDVFESYTVT